MKIKKKKKFVFIKINLRYKVVELAFEKATRTAMSGDDVLQIYEEVVN